MVPMAQHPDPMTPATDPGLDAETRDAIRDLCLAVATLASGTVHIIGTTTASEVMRLAAHLSLRMDALNVEAPDA